MSVAALRRTRPAPPVRIVHLGLGSFFRAHQAAYTDLAPDAGQWGIAAFSGRSGDLARTLAGQDGLYTLITRGPEDDEFSLVASVVQAQAGTDDEAWLARLRDPALACVTVTVTEYGYRDGPAMARLAAGLEARRRAGGGPLAVVSCDNLLGNGAVTRRAVLEAAHRIDPSLPDWIGEQVSFPSTMVDRITPRPTPDLTELVAERTGRHDDCPLVTEPFSEWVISGDFPAGRPAWEQAGAQFVADVEPHELRKLRLLNGAHSLLAYVGSSRGLTTVAAAISDATCRDWVQQWWDEASIGLDLPGETLLAYRAQLLERWANPRIEHRLAQIAADGSQKLPVRVLPVLRLRRAAGDLPIVSVTIIAAWIGCLRRLGAQAEDAALAEVLPLIEGSAALAARRVLAWLDPPSGDLADDSGLVSALADALAPYWST